MQDLIQFFIDQASINGDYLTGMVIAGIIVLTAIMIFSGYIFNQIISFFRNNKIITIKKVEKFDKIIEVPKYVENAQQYKEVLKKLKEIEDKVDKINSKGIKL